MRIDDFIAASHGVVSQAELTRLFVSAIGSYGYDRFLYASLRGPGSELPALARNYPEDWMRTYEERDYRINDPVRLKVDQARGAFTWESVMRGRLTRSQRRLMAEADEAGLKDGVAVPIYLPRGEVVGLGLASSRGGTDPQAHLVPLYMLSLQFHTIWSALAQPQPAVLPRLTGREIEVLKWAAQGKSNWAIGEIMTISEHGVHYHLRNILRKLQVDSRTTAVVKAYHLGLITLS